MTEFKVGDRVRVRKLSGTVPYSGRVGEVASVNSTLGGVVYGCRVKLDQKLPGDPSESGVAFLQSELEPEAGN
jgi:hypothetical protein